MSRYSSYNRSRGHYREPIPWVGLIVGLAFVIAIIAVPIRIILWESTTDTVTCTVEEKDRTTKKDGGSDQRVYTDCGVFRVADDMWKGQWNSSDLYSQINEGNTYTFETVGWRNGFFSDFPNVYKAAEVQ